MFLLRGAFNVFSLGMDEITEKLQRPGVRTTVANWISWAIARRSGRGGIQKRSGTRDHSGRSLFRRERNSRDGRPPRRLGVPVRLAIGLDPTSRMVASGHVDRYINYYIANGLGTAVVRGRQFTGTLQNVDVEKNPSLNHFNIDKNRALQERVLSEIRAAL